MYIGEVCTGLKNHVMPNKSSKCETNCVSQELNHTNIRLFRNALIHNHAAQQQPLSCDAQLT